MFDSAAFLKTVPTKPGIYIMRDASDVIIYVGKAKNLKNRLSSYFRASGLSTKTMALVSHIASIEVTITNSENDALRLESNLIKKHRPRYNVSLIDDKSYPYIYLSLGQYPRLAYYRGSKKHKGRYFGPYPSSSVVRDTLDLMKKLFLIRQCEDSVFKHRTRPCLQYQIKRCSAPCVNKITPEQYQKDVHNAVLFLEGNSQTLISELVSRMQQCVADLKFEAAAVIRDQIKALQAVQSTNDIEQGSASLDLIAHAEKGGLHAVEVLTIRDGRVLGARAYFPKVPSNTDAPEILQSFIEQYYDAARLPPSHIILNHALSIENGAWLESHLSELSHRKISIAHHVKGQRARWLDLAHKNAEQAIEIKLAGASNIQHRLQELADLLHLLEIERIECFDISHSFGEKTVASDVVYTKEGLTKKFYRRFNIEGITGGDDYAAMRQAITRRFSHTEDNPLPDILLIDGGKNQLQVGIDVMCELGIDSVVLIGVAKGEGRKVGLETLWKAGDDTPIDIESTSAAFHLITQIRDEAHRFAIEGHRSQRDKLRRRSVLEDIKGIGPQRRATLLSHFGGLLALKNATVEDIAKVPGISDSLAKVIHEALHEE
ncbi:excinuclease ABC subunit C [Wohlfahrtiimonas chitiniclastica]|uniref:excinuclease ABC subunit UvrC n=1 Tax=Wohlfahrtiimonas chitiniclastica TaxID=400946 RepID=UPI000B9983EA|nr:excinuclease ABC subunit UvrC [Wohlfahrtiimonas chitiniclastica]OYQ78629.1 excinuclease ABC subunit C [Wohlfahrtiimonas chitiniclastica]OYQ82409.1 excinuclease ABC subunit C [Wohlfahrtiimonas chitiniclastica]OYQ83443.1 excinuclease ABC subunit C [Wohlfahrtiimonas chitiniclastica]